MLTETGRVVAVEADGLWVQTVRQSTCGSCAAQAGCGHGLMNRMSAQRQLGLVRALADPAQLAACRIDDEVRIALPESVVLQASALVYVLPLLTLLAGAVAMNALWPAGGDLASVAGAVLGLGAGFLSVRWHARRHRNDRRFQPALVEVLPRATQSLQLA
jgi:sigma-E factor negative regulatory protein RseC